jgi:hypothetical protein
MLQETISKIAVKYIFEIASSLSTISGAYQQLCKINLPQMWRRECLDTGMKWLYLSLCVKYSRKTIDSIFI